MPPELVRDDYIPYSELAGFVGQEKQKIPYVEGTTLGEAVERALTIYKMADMLKNISLPE